MNSVTISTFHMVSHNLIFLFRFEDFMYRNNDCNNRPKKVFRISGWTITKLSFDQNKCVLYLNIWIRLHLLKKSFMFFQCKINYRVWRESLPGYIWNHLYEPTSLLKVVPCHEHHCAFNFYLFYFITLHFYCTNLKVGI